MTEMEFIDSIVKDKNTGCLGAFITDTFIGFIMKDAITLSIIEKFNNYNKHWTIYNCNNKGLEIQIPRTNK